MNIHCTNWEDAGVPGAGRCKLNLYGGTPSCGICLQVCKRYDGPKVELPKPERVQSDCGCARRKAMLNRIVPGLGNVVEKILEPVAKLLR